MLDTTERAKITALADTLGATLYWDADAASSASGPRALALSKTAWLDPNAPDAYWVSRHELGHIAGNHNLGADGVSMALFGYATPNIVENESAAWLWGFEHSDRPLDEMARTTVVASLTSYILLADPDVDTPSLRKITQLIGHYDDVDGVNRLMGTIIRRGGYTAQGVVDEWNAVVARLAAADLSAAA